MGHPADSSGLRVMHCVVVDVDWHAQNVERHVRRHNEEDAVLAIAAIVEEIVDRSCLRPRSINLEVNARHLALVLALCQDDTLSKLPIVDVCFLEERVDE